MKKSILLLLMLVLATSLAIAGTRLVNFVSAQDFVTIKADGSIDPSTAPIQHNGDVYTVVGDIDDFVLLERNNTVFDGAGHTVGGIYGPIPVQVGYEYQVNATSNMKIMNAIINGDGVFFLATQNSVFAHITLNNGRGLDCVGNRNVVANNTVNAGRGISVSGKANIIYGNRLTNCNYTFAENNPPPYGIIIAGSNNIAFGNYIIGTNWSAINLGTSSDNIIFGNQVEDNRIGIRTLAIYSQGSAENNTVYYNNFVNNLKNYHDEMIMMAPASVTVWDYNAVGNYWSNYNGTDANGDGVGDTPCVIDANNYDHYPLMTPVEITSVEQPSPSPSPTPTPTPSSSPTPTLSPSSEPTPSPSLEPEPESEPFPVVPVAVTSAAAVVVVGVVLLVYFKKRKR